MTTIFGLDDATRKAWECVDRAGKPEPEIAAPKGLAEMTTAELWSLFTAVSEAIYKSKSAAELWRFHGAINKELSRRGF